MKCEDQSSNCGFKLYRDVENARLAGVCAGVADYFSIDVGLVRFLTIVSGIFFTFVTICVYVCGALFLDPKPKDLYEEDTEEEYWRNYRKSPRNTMAEARRRFRKLEQRLRRAESYVTSNRFNLDREFENLDK
ncbi:MAG: envelope stress response membrane protein PspC [bacterium]